MILTATIVFLIWVSCVIRDACTVSFVVDVDADGILGTWVKTTRRYTCTSFTHSVCWAILIAFTARFNRWVCCHCEKNVNIRNGLHLPNW